MSLIKPVYAIITNPAIKSVTNGYTYTNSVIKTFITILLILGVIYFFLHFVLAGYKIISSQGDSKKYEEGMASLRNALIGIIVVFSVYAIIALLATMFGIKFGPGLTLNWPSL